MTTKDHPTRRPDGRPHDLRTTAPGARETRAASPVMRVQPIHVPEEWDDADLLTFEQFCNLIQTPPRTVRDWRRRRVGPRWIKLEGSGRLFITVAEVRRFLRAVIAAVGRQKGPSQAEGRPA